MAILKFPERRREHESVFIIREFRKAITHIANELGREPHEIIEFLKTETNVFQRKRFDTN